ncbi:MAG TPA: glycosyltransferase [Methylomirabilota bacterium]|nr:glycosyltransferase [Methylomirabilota bacterium]
MRVALIVPGGVDRGGEERVIPALLWLIERLARRHDLHVLALYQEPRPATYDLRRAAVQVVGRRFTRVRALAYLLRSHRQAPFDVLHAFWATPPGVLAVSAGRLVGRPVLLHLAGGEVAARPEIGYGGLLRRRGRMWVRFAIRGASCVTAASGPMLDAARRYRRDVERLPLGVDLVRWPRRNPRPRDPTRPAQLLHVGSINAVKDHATLLGALSILTASGAAVHLHVVGEDTMGGRVQSLAHSLGLSKRVTFHGFLPHRSLRPLVETMDLHLVTSRHEAGPVALLEAAVAGVPSVGTDVGHVHDWAPDAALAVPVGDAPALAAAIGELLRDEPRRLRLADAAQARACREDADWTADRVSMLYQELTRSQGAS